MPKSSKTPRRPAVRSRASARPQPQPGTACFTPAETRVRHDGWTRERQTGFIRALAESGCVEEACGTVGMSRQSAYRLRARIDAQGFRMAWDQAVDYAMRRLTDACLSRAINGEARPIFYKGEQIGERRVYDNKLAMFLLRYRDPLRYAASLDQMVYSGQPEAAAMNLDRAIDRVADEAEGIWIDEADADPLPEPFTSEPIAELRARDKAEAIVAGTGPIHGSHARRAQIHEARRAYQLKQSGYGTEEEWVAGRIAKEEEDVAWLRRMTRRGWSPEAGGAAEGDAAEGDARAKQSGADVASPLSPSGSATGPTPDGERPVRTDADANGDAGPGSPAAPSCVAGSPRAKPAHLTPAVRRMD